MGYRSEVKSLVYGTPEVMTKFKSDNVEILAALALDFGTELTQFNNDTFDIIYLSCCYSKWYDSFAEVIRWHNLLKLANDAELMSEFVRIGEDCNGDIEQEYSEIECEYYLQTVCTINANF